ncbi:MAG: peptidylprolyl isomerase [Gemmatimonadaceae bacterium]|nr:peptidylprolyl isomerase [Gemmatimonadaceae bacterium]
MRIIDLGTCLALLGAAIALPAVALTQAVAPPVESAPLPATQKRAALRNPAAAFWRVRAPDTAYLEMETSRGTISVALIREWAPHGVDRFYNLARAGYFDDSRFFRVLPWYIAQFGIAGDPAVYAIWSRRKIPADSVRTTNARGTLSFAQYSPSERTTNVFINLRDSPTLDSLGFAPIGRVVAGQEAADSLYSGYGETPSMAAPIGNPRRLYGESNRYLDRAFPRLDRIVRITVQARSVPGAMKDSVPRSP